MKDTTDMMLPRLPNEHIWSNLDVFGLCTCLRCQTRRVAFNASFRYISADGIVDDYDAEEEQPFCAQRDVHHIHAA